MHIDVITAVPELLSGPFNHSIIARAAAKGIATVQVHDLRQFGMGKHRQVDDYQYGGGAGMVLMAEPIWSAVEALSQHRTYSEIIYLSPDGELLDQPLSNELSLAENLLLICGHYKGIDQRIRDYLVTREISIGNYVLSGGELAAAVLADSVIRLIPGVLNDETSALSDSFQDDLLAPPAYTRPANFKGHTVPDVLLSGDFAAIEKWRIAKAEERTARLRPELWNKKTKG